MRLEEQLSLAAQAAGRFAEDGEELTGVVPTEPGVGQRVYLCAYRRGEERSWLALDVAGRAIGDRALVREAISIAAMCELAEESAAGGDVAELRARLADLRATEEVEGIEEAELAVAELEASLLPAPRVASAAYLDAIGAAALKLEQALGHSGTSPFAEAMKAGIGAAEELVDDVVRRYKHPLDQH